MNEQTPSASWKKCGSCKDGQVCLLTSVRVCEACQGTGVDLSDPKLDAEIKTPNTPVRVSKGLKHQGIENLRDLVCQAAAGKLRLTRWFGRPCIEEARSYLRNMGLPAGPELPPAGDTEVNEWW